MIFNAFADLLTLVLFTLVAYATGRDWGYREAILMFRPDLPAGKLSLPSWWRWAILAFTLVMMIVRDFIPVKP